MPTSTPTTFGTIMTDVVAAVGTISGALPIVTALYATVSALWLKVNPGMTLADFEAALASSSGALVIQSDALLAADGYSRVLQPDGTYHWVQAALTPAK